jgi:hypothetical protein
MMEIVEWKLQNENCKVGLHDENFIVEMQNGNA